MMEEAKKRLRICITLDDVVRAKTRKIGETYQKFIDPTIDLDSLEITSCDMSKVLPFKSRRAYQEFLYQDYCLDIFGNAPTATKLLGPEINQWLVSLENMDTEYDIEVFFANPLEFNQSIGMTHFFLSRYATRVRKVLLPEDSITLWDECDVMVTAYPTLLENVPEGKKCVRIDMPYNTEIESGMSYGTLHELISDESFIEKVTGQ